MPYFTAALGTILDRGLTLSPEAEPPPQPEGYASTVLNLSGGAPFAYWRKGNTTQITDEVGTRHGTYTGTVALVPGLPQNSDGAINYGGVGTGAVPHDAGLSLETGALSLWVGVHSFPVEAVSPQMPVICKDDIGQTLDDFHLSVQDEGTISAVFQQGVGMPSETLLLSLVELGTPYHIVVQWSPAGVEAYLDAELKGTSAVHITGWSGNTRELSFAKRTFHSVDGDVTIDEVALFNRLLTQTEITQLAQRTATNPVTVGDAAQVNESATTVINVVANDTFVGNKADLTVTIVDDSEVTAAGHSISVNANNDIAFVASAVAANEIVSFTYTITDAVGTSAAATVTVTVQNVGAPVVGNANCFVIGTGGVVASMAALQNAVNAAAPGDNILIAPGAYDGGALTFNRDGTEANPIVVRPQNGLGTVTINDNGWTISDTASWLVFDRLHFTRGQILLFGDHNRISRGRFRAAAIRLETARDCRIDHCEFSDDGASSRTPIDLRGAATFASGARARILIDYCHFHDIAITSQVIDQFGDADRTANDMETGESATIDHCLFENIDNNGEFIVNKCGGMVWSFNTFDGVNGYFQFRSGAHCVVRSCWWENTEDPHFWSEDNLVIGNRFIGTLNAWVPCGNGSWEGQQDGSLPTNRYEPATNSRFIGNRFGSGHLQLGKYWNNFDPADTFLPANNNLLEANTRDSGGNAHEFITVPLNPGHTNTTINATTAEPFVPAVKLTATDVGLNAPDPLCP